MKFILLLLIKIYQALFSFDHGIPHTLFPHTRICIYTPSCSAYGYEAIKKYGSIIGGCMTVKRVLSCGPWSEGGYAPVKEIDLNRFQKLLTYI